MSLILAYCFSHRPEGGISLYLVYTWFCEAAEQTFVQAAGHRLAWHSKTCFGFKYVVHRGTLHAVFTYIRVYTYWIILLFLLSLFFFWPYPSDRQEKKDLTRSKLPTDSIFRWVNVVYPDRETSKGSASVDLWHSKPWLTNRIYLLHSVLLFVLSATISRGVWTHFLPVGAATCTFGPPQAPLSTP